MRRCLLLLAILSSALHCIAQQREVDSLLALLPDIKGDTARALLMSAITFKYSHLNPDTGSKWAEKELALVREMDWQKGEAMAWFDAGGNYHNKGSFPAALDAFFKSLRIDEALGDKSHTAKVLASIAIVYLRQKDYGKALELYGKALTIAEELGETQNIIKHLGGIGVVYDSQGSHAEAIEYELRALRMAEAAKENPEIIRNTGNLGNSYMGLKQYNVALAFSYRALRMSEAADDKRSIALNLCNVGKTYYLIATAIASPLPDSLVPASRAASLTKAIDFLKRSIAACRELQYNRIIPEAAQCLADALAVTGDYKGALDAYKESVAIADTLNNTANNEKIANLETVRAISLKDKDIEIARLRKRDERFFFTFSIVLLLGGSVLLYHRYRRRQARGLQHMRQQISKDLHDDIGAAITSIGILANISKSDMVDSGRRKEFLETIASQSRHVSEALADIVWSVNPEADELDVMLARFQRYAAEIFEAKGIHYEFSLPPEGMNDLKLNMEQRQHLLLIFKEAVNNLAKYSEATEARITVSLQPHQLIMTIADNGVGFDAAKPRRGNGLGNMRKRAAALGAAFELQSFVREGTSIRLVIPVS